MCMPAALHATSPTSKKPYNHSTGDEIFHFTYLYRDISSELLHLHNGNNPMCQLCFYTSVRPQPEEHVSRHLTLRKSVSLVKITKRALVKLEAECALTD